MRKPPAPPPAQLAAATAGGGRTGACARRGAAGRLAVALCAAPAPPRRDGRGGCEGCGGCGVRFLPTLYVGRRGRNVTAVTQLLMRRARRLAALAEERGRSNPSLALGEAAAPKPPPTRRTRHAPLSLPPPYSTPPPLHTRGRSPKHNSPSRPRRPRRPSGIVDCGRTVVREEGVRALWKGLTPFATHLTLKYALRMGSNSVYQVGFKASKI